MKMILAIVQPELLPDIKEGLLKAKISKLTVSIDKGHGTEVPEEELIPSKLYYKADAEQDPELQSEAAAD